MVTLPKKFWPRVSLLDSAAIKFYAGECTPSSAVGAGDAAVSLSKFFVGQNLV